MGSNPFNYRAPGTGGLFPTQVSEFVPQQGNIGRGLQTAGQSLLNASGVLHERFLKKQAVDTKREALNLYSQFRLEDARQAPEFKQSYDGDLREFAPSDFKRRGELFSKYQDLASTPEVREALGNQFADYNISQQVSSESYQVAAVANKAISDTSDTLDNLTNAIFRSPDLYEENLALGYEAIEAVAPDIESSKITEMQQSYKDAAGLAFIKSRADINPSQTLKELKSGEYDPYLTQTGMETIKRQLESELEQKKKERLSLVRQDINEGMEGHITSLMQTGVPLLDRSDVEKAEDPRLLEKYDHWTDVSKKFYDVVGGTSGQPLVDRARAIEVLNPNSKDFKGPKNAKNYEKHLRVYESAKALLAREEEQYQKDPVAFASQNSTEVQKAYAHSPGRGMQAAINYQISRGARPWEVQLFSKEQSEDISGRLNLMLEQGNLEQAKQLLTDMQSEYSGVTVPGYSYTAYDIAKNNIVDAGGNAQFIRALDFADNKDQRLIIQAATNGEKDYKALYTNDQVKAIYEGVNNKLRPIINAITRQPDFAGIEELAEQKDLAAKLALEYKAKGLDDQEAITRAAQTIFPYETVKERNMDIAILNSEGINIGLFKERANREQKASNIRDFMKRHSFEKAFEKQDPFQTLSSFAKSNGLKITAGKDSSGHNKGSLHYQGRAIDVDHRGVSYEDLVRKARKIGGRVIDERRNPGRGRVWTGPHYHIEIPVGAEGNVKLSQQLSDTAIEGLVDSAAKDGVWLLSPDHSSVVLHTKQLDGSMRPLTAPDGTIYSKTIYELGAAPELSARETGRETRPVVRPGETGYFSLLSK